MYLSFTGLILYDDICVATINRHIEKVSRVSTEERVCVLGNSANP